MTHQILIQNSAHGVYADKLFTVQTDGVYSYNFLTGDWSITPVDGTPPVLTENAAVTQKGNTVYIFGGNEPGSTQPVPTTSIWDLQTNQFSQGADMPNPTTNGSAVYYKGTDGQIQVMCFGGVNNEGTVSGINGTYEPQPFKEPEDNFFWEFYKADNKLNSLAVTQNGGYDKIVAVGNSGTVLTSPDNGATWFTPEGTNSSDNINAVAPIKFDSPGYIAAGENHAFFFDGSDPLNPRIVSVNEPNSHQSENFQAVAQNEDKIIAVGNNGNQAAISQWTNYQGTWEHSSVTPHYQYDNLKSCFIDPFGTWHVGGEGSYYKYNQNGQSLGYQDIPNMGSVNDIFFTSENNGYMIGNNGALNTTTNGGTTWQTGNVSSSLCKSTNLQRFINEDLNSICFYDENYGIIVGNGGTILATYDGGATWNELTSGHNK